MARNKRRKPVRNGLITFDDSLESFFGLHSPAENGLYLRQILRGYRSLNADIIAHPGMPEPKLSSWRAVRDSFASYLSTIDIDSPPFIATRDIADNYSRLLGIYRDEYLRYTGQQPTLRDKTTLPEETPSSYGWILPAALGIGALILAKELKGIFK